VETVQVEDAKEVVAEKVVPSDDVLEDTKDTAVENNDDTK